MLLVLVPGSLCDAAVAVCSSVCVFVCVAVWVCAVQLQHLRHTHADASPLHSHTHREPHTPADRQKDDHFIWNWTLRRSDVSFRTPTSSYNIKRPDPESSEFIGRTVTNTHLDVPLEISDHFILLSDLIIQLLHHDHRVLQLQIQHSQITHSKKDFLKQDTTGE